MADGSLQGKTVLITGATQGIGLAAAVGIARNGPRLLLVGRDSARTDAAVEHVKRESGNGDVSSYLCDLSSQEAIRELAARVKAEHSRLHVLVNNAGGIFQKRQVTVDGYEQTFALNHLAPFLLTSLLKDTLVASAPARVITTSSGAHLAGRLDFGDLMMERRYGAWRQYGNSKLCNILFTRELARRLEGTRVTANCFHPGFVASGFGHNNGGIMSWGISLARPFAKTPEQGARSAVYLATSADVEAVTGKYFAKSREATPSAAARDDASARRLWAVSEALTGPRIPRASVA